MHKHHHRAAPMRRHTLTSAIAITLALGLAGPALAQQAAPADQPRSSRAATPQELDVVTVTANKREENIREVATAVTKLTDEQLENINATQMSDYANYVPGLQVQDSGSPGQTQVSMRGIAPLSSGSTVGTYVDEAPIGSNSLYQQATLFALDLLPYDIDSIEVLRGPQGTLYGAGAMGGLIKYVMKKPDTTQNEFRVGMGVSDTQGADGTSLNYRIGGNLVLAQDSVALRASFASNEPNGYVDNLVTAARTSTMPRRAAAALSALWKNDKASVQFALMKQKIDSPNNAIIALDPVTHDDIHGLANFVDVDEALQEGHRELRARPSTTTAASPTSCRPPATPTSPPRSPATRPTPTATSRRCSACPGSAYLTNDLRLKQFTQEFRLSSKADAPFEWLVGGFYDDERGDNHQFVPLNQRDGSPLPPPFDALVGSLGDLFLPSTYEETAVFGNGAYKFNDLVQARRRRALGAQRSRSSRRTSSPACSRRSAPSSTPPAKTSSPGASRRSSRCRKT
jgi:iron complex outermembrane receptor protein